MRKAWKITLDVVVWCIFLLAVVMMLFTIISVRTVGKNDAFLFGYKPFVIQSDSMKGEFSAGDMIICKKVDTSTLQAGDIITFRSSDPQNFGAVITHKIRAVNEDGTFTTYSIATGQDDLYSARPQDVIAKYCFTLKGFGNFFAFMRTPLGYVSLIGVPFAIVIVLQAVQVARNWKKYRAEKEQTASVELSQKQQVEEELRLLKEEVEKLRKATVFEETDRSDQEESITPMQDAPTEEAEDETYEPSQQEQQEESIAPMQDAPTEEAEDETYEPSQQEQQEESIAPMQDAPTEEAEDEACEFSEQNAQGREEVQSEKIYPTRRDRNRERSNKRAKRKKSR